MILDPGLSRRPPWGRALLLVGGVHLAAIGSLFVRFAPPLDPNADMPAMAVEMATPAAIPAPTRDAPTPRQIEAPKQTPQEQPQPKKPMFVLPPTPNLANVTPEVVLPPEKKAQTRPEKVNPLPPAPTTTELAAPDLKPDTRTSALLNNGASAGKASPDALWDARVRARIELTKRYPAIAARQNQQDEVDVLLSIDRAGRLLDARVRASRGFAVLNEAALDAVRHAAPFPKPPKEIEGDPIRLSVIVRFFKRMR